jgi:uncharacterized protein DUF6883
VHWPPRIGEPLPRAAEALGVREKLVGYSLDLTNEVGGPKARGFRLILGITMADVDYLERVLRNGILTAPVCEIRDNAPYGINCMVAVPVQGLREKSKRIVGVRTVWEIATVETPPRLVSAFPRP